MNSIDEWSASDAIIIHVLSDMKMMMIHDCHYLWGKAIILSPQCFLCYSVGEFSLEQFFFFFEFPDFLMLMFSHVVWSHALDVSSSDKAWWLYYKNGDMNGASCCSLNIYYWAPAAPHVKNYCGWKWGLFQPFEAADWFPNTG